MGLMVGRIWELGPSSNRLSLGFGTDVTYYYYLEN